jgi:Glycosyltransferase like family
MIAFGCSIISPELYERCAERGIRRAGEPDSRVFAVQAAGSIFRTYNLILDQAAACDDLEALVLVHEDAEILDADFCEKLRYALRDPAVGVVGCVGAVGVRSIAWWEGSATVGSFVHRYQELGGGEFQALSPNGHEPTSHPRTGRVDTVYGFMMALSRWAVRNIRFDESLGPHWGYDFDYCLQVHATNRKVVTADLNVAHHHSLALVTDPEPWMAAHMRAAEKWEGRLPHTGGAEVDWKPRARRSEAEAVVARLQGAAQLLRADARSAAQARRLRSVTDTNSWRLTEPLRRLNALRKALRRGQR